MCDLDNKLNQILDKLEDIIKRVNKIEAVFICEFIKQKCEPISLKLERLINNFKSFMKTQQKNDARKHIKVLCNNPTEGFEKIFALFA